MSQIIGWGGWSWPGWSAIAALGAATAAGAALWALFYFRKQAGVMLEQLKDAQRDEHSRQKQRLEEAQMSVTPLVSLEGGPVSLPENAGHNYQARVTAHADGAGFAHNLILNLQSGEGGGHHVATQVLDYLRAGSEQEVVFTCPVDALPLVGPGPMPHVSLIEVRGLFFNPWGQQIKFTHAGRIDLNDEKLSFTTHPVYEWPWETLTVPPADA